MRSFDPQFSYVLLNFLSFMNFKFTYICIWNTTHTKSYFLQLTLLKLYALEISYFG